MNEEKTKLREKIKKEWQSLDKNSRKKLTEKAVAKILENEIFINEKNILIYAPIKNEISFTEDLMQKFPEKKFYFPSIENDEINFYESNFCDVKKGKFGILEPQKDLVKKFREKTAFVFVPFLAVDKNLNRLGNGGGFYDKFFTKNKDKKIYKICISPKFSVFKKIPTETHDQKIDEIIII